MLNIPDIWNSEYSSNWARAGQLGLSIARQNEDNRQGMFDRWQRAQQEQREQTMAPLRQQLMQNQITSSALGIQQGLNEQQDYLSNQKAITELSAVMADINGRGAWSDEASKRKVWEIGVKYPSVTATPAWQKAEASFAVAEKKAMELNEMDFRRSQEASLNAYRNRHLDIMEKQGEEANASRERIAETRTSGAVETARMRYEHDVADRMGQVAAREFAVKAKIIEENYKMTDAEKFTEINRIYGETMNKFDKKGTYDPKDPAGLFGFKSSPQSTVTEPPPGKGVIPGQ